MPSVLYFWNNASVERANSSRAFAVENTLEHGSQPPQPPSDRITLSAWVSFLKRNQARDGERIATVVYRELVAFEVTEAEDDVRQLFDSKAIYLFRAAGVVGNDIDLTGRLRECSGA